MHIDSKVDEMMKEKDVMDKRNEVTCKKQATVIAIDADRYGELLVAERKLQALESAGVINWEGYDDAVSHIEDDDDCECGGCEECYNESEEEADARHNNNEKEEQNNEDAG
jgi:hypothetical protein